MDKEQKEFIAALERLAAWADGLSKEASGIVRMYKKPSKNIQEPDYHALAVKFMTDRRKRLTAKSK